jgi:MSHA biogenesis protein MshL
MNRQPRSSLRRLASALLGAATLFIGGCASSPTWLANPPLMPELKATLQPRPESLPAPATAAASAAVSIAPTASTAAREDPALAILPVGRSERRFSVVLNNASPEVLFMALLAETPLSVAVDPGVKGPLSISLKDVTLREALDLLRELHGLEYKVIGRHILVAQAQLQTRIFTVDYPSFNRSGRSELRVLSGSITGSTAPSSPGSAQSTQGGQAGATGGGSAGGSNSQESSRISTAQRNDLWAEIETTIKLLVGDKDGRSVVVSPQTGNIVLRAFPREIRAVNDYLEATRISVQRQVMLEAKVVEVQLSNSERTGINWSAFKLGLSTRASGGMVSPGASLSPSGTIGDGLITVNPGAALASAATAAGSLLGLAFQTQNFAAVLDFLGTQGNTQVLSSPRIATMNNQKAVLKVGTDDFFVTSISSTTTAVGNTTATTPNIGVQPFFSGISLDVTPNIDANGYITLHVHPSVSTVTERTKVINLGTQGSYALPLASSEINESDAVVRAHDGNIIAIGGLMRQSSVNSDSGVPGTEGTFWRKMLGGQTNRLSEKRELVILLKPTIVDPSLEDGDLRRDALQRLLDWTDTLPAKPTAAAPPPPAATAPQAAARPILPVAITPAPRSAPDLNWAAMGAGSLYAAAAASPTPRPVPTATRHATAQAAHRLPAVFVTVGHRAQVQVQVQVEARAYAYTHTDAHGRAGTRESAATLSRRKPAVAAVAAAPAGPRLALSQPARPRAARLKVPAALPGPSFVFVDAGAAGAARAAAAARAARPPPAEAPWAPLLLRSVLWATPLPKLPLRAVAAGPPGRLLPSG